MAEQSGFSNQQRWSCRRCLYCALFDSDGILEDDTFVATSFEVGHGPAVNVRRCLSRRTAGVEFNLTAGKDVRLISGQSPRNTQSVMTLASAFAPANRFRARWTIWFLGLLPVIAGVCWWYRPAPLPPGITQRDFDMASRRFQTLYSRRPDANDILSMAGELAVAEERFAAAAACFHQIPRDHPRYGPSARFQEAQVRLRLNQAAAAEQNFRDYLGLKNPGQADAVALARKWLMYILSVELRFEDRQRELAAIHAAGTPDLGDSKQYFFPNLLIWNSATGRQRLAEFIEVDPGDFNLRLAKGRYLTGAGQLDDANVLLQELYRQHPESPACAAALLECLFERNDWKEFAATAGKIPSQRTEEPWLLVRMRGEFALSEQRWDDAIRNFLHLAELEPANPWSSMGLAKAYGMQGRLKERDSALARALVLSRIRVSLSNVREDNVAGVRNLANECRQIELLRAAEAFDRHAQRIVQSEHGAGDATGETGQPGPGE